MKFRKRPVVIDAIQWTGANAHEVRELSDKVTIGYDGDLFIQTLEGRMHATKGDWIIKGVQGEFYPCKPDIFEKTYEAI
jgi:hypothetical protein